jgi:hypothetical protein
MGRCCAPSALQEVLMFSQNSRKTPPRITAGAYPLALVDACAQLEIDPAALLDWAVKKCEVALVLPSGQKVRLIVGGDWSTGNCAAGSHAAATATRKARGPK